MKKISITTLGCKVNQADSGIIIAKYTASGYRLADTGADICIINTCTVTAKADRECRQAIRRLRRTNPKARIIVTGCYANIAASELKEMPEVACVMTGGQMTGGHTLFQKCVSPEGSPEGKRSRPLLKIQDGCNNFCAYCIVPHARGKSLSLPPGDVLKMLKDISSSGYYEVVLTGVHLGGYGADLSPKTNLVKLLKFIAGHDLGLRLRLSSVDPNEWSGDLTYHVASNPHICGHFHIPLQSGDNEILKKMGRHYTTEEYRDLILRLRSAVHKSDPSIGTDIIVGFPGETNAHFERAAAFMDSLPLTYFHVFPYSARPMTKAWELGDTVTNREKNRRASVLRGISEAKRREFYRKQVGGKMDVVIENRRDKKTGRLKGISANYVPVLIAGDDGLLGKHCMTGIKGVSGDCVIGEVIKNSKS